jgi:hypothetical protein
MKSPTTPSAGKADASLDTKLNPVELGSKEIVSWGVAFPRVWRTDATIGSVVGTVSRAATLSGSD